MKSNRVLIIALGLSIFVGCSHPIEHKQDTPTQTPFLSPAELLSPTAAVAPTFTPCPTEVVPTETSSLPILIQDTRYLAGTALRQMQEDHVTSTGLVGVYAIEGQYAATIIVPNLGADPIYVFLQNSEGSWQVIGAAAPYPDRVISQLNLPEWFAETSPTYHILKQAISYVQEAGTTTGYLHIEGVCEAFVRVCVTLEDQSQCSLTLFLKAQAQSFENWIVLIGETSPSKEVLDQYEIPEELRRTR